MGLLHGCDSWNICELGAFRLSLSASKLHKVEPYAFVGSSSEGADAR